ARGLGGGRRRRRGRTGPGSPVTTRRCARRRAPLRRWRGPENDENEGAGRVPARTGQVRAGEGPRRTLRDQEGGGRLTPALRRDTAGPVGATGDRGGGRRGGDRGQARRRARLVGRRPVRGPPHRGRRRAGGTQDRPAV